MHEIDYETKIKETRSIENHQIIDLFNIMELLNKFKIFDIYFKILVISST